MTKKAKLSRPSNREISVAEEKDQLEEKPVNNNTFSPSQDKNITVVGGEDNNKRSSDFFRRISARLTCTRRHSGPKSKAIEVPTNNNQQSPGATETVEIPKLIKSNPTNSDESDVGNVPLLSTTETPSGKMSSTTVRTTSKGTSKSRVGYSALKSSNRQFGAAGGRGKLISRHVSVTPKTSEPSGGAKSERKTGGFGSRLSIHSMFFTSSNPAGSTLGTSRAVSVGCGDTSRSKSTNDLQRPGSEMSAFSGDSLMTSDRESVLTTEASGSQVGGKLKELECPLCFTRLPRSSFPDLITCHHRSCLGCLIQYLQMEIMEARVNISCPECSTILHPSDVYKILADHPRLIHKWEEFSVRRVLINDPDSRWCPAPDCNYAVIAAGCAGCPVITCGRPGCNMTFCYHCKQPWHATQTCDEARVARGSFAMAPIHVDSTIKPGDIKACPRCQTYIVKMQDGSCNHMVCPLCGAEFCWLCLKEISDLHYLSPSGCTFWGKKPWSRKKKLLWQLGTLIGAPVGIALVAGLAVPAIIFGVPVWVGRKINHRLKHTSTAKHHIAVAGGVISTFLLSPVFAALAVGVGVPIMLAYVYGVVPFSLCRNGTCGMAASKSGVRLDTDEEIMEMTGLFQPTPLNRTGDIDNKDARLSIHSDMTQHKLQVQAEVFPTRRRQSVESGVTLLGDRNNYEEASLRALAGSTYCDDKSVHTIGSANEAVSYCAEDASLTGMAGSVCGAQSTAGISADLRSCHSGAVSARGDSVSQKVFVGQLDRAASPSLSAKVSHGRSWSKSLVTPGHKYCCSSVSAHDHQRHVDFGESGVLRESLEELAANLMQLGKADSDGQTESLIIEDCSKASQKTSEDTNVPSTSGEINTTASGRSSTVVSSGTTFVVCAECHKRASVDSSIISSDAVPPGIQRSTSTRVVPSELLRQRNSDGGEAPLPLGLVEETVGSDDEFDANEQQPFWNSPAMANAKGFVKLPSFVFSSTAPCGSTPVRLSTSVSDVLNNTLPRPSHNQAELNRFSSRSPNEPADSQHRGSGLKKSTSLSFVWDTLAAIQEVRRLRAASTTSLSGVGRKPPLRSRTEPTEGKRWRISCDSAETSSSSRTPATTSEQRDLGLNTTAKRRSGSGFDWKFSKKIGKLEKLDDDDDEQLSRLYMEPPARNSFAADSKSDSGKGVSSNWKNLFSGSGKKRVTSGSYASLPDMEDRQLGSLRKK